MVVTSIVELTQLNPLVAVSVVELCSERRLIDVLTRSGNNYQVFSETAARVTVTRVLHAFLSLHHILISLGGYKLVTLEHRVRHLVKVTSSNDKDLSVEETNLDGLEIMREISSCVYCMQSHGLSPRVVYVELL